jgi:hypothetical protein
MHEPVQARYEFRAFAPNLETVAGRLAAESRPSELERFHDLYIVSRLTIDGNVKLRGDRLEVKELMAREGLFELWSPRLIAEMPIASDRFIDEVAPCLGLDMKRPRIDMLAETDIVQLCATMPALEALRVDKVRRQFTFAHGLGEHVKLEVLSRAFESVAIEAQDLDDAQRLAAASGLDQHLNNSYPAFLQELAFPP